MSAPKIEPTHPMQPLVVDDHGVVRFKRNEIVRDLLKFASERGMDLNVIAMTPSSDDDKMQFWQLLGYSVGAYGELDFVSDAVYDDAETKARAQFGHL